MSTNGQPLAHLGELLRPIKREVDVRADIDYSVLGARWYAKGLYIKETKSGSLIKASKLFEVREGDFVYNRLFAWKGSFAVASPENDGCFVSNEFPCFEVDHNRLDSKYLWYYFSREPAWNEALGLSYGATPTSRNRLNERQLFSIQIPLPPLVEQRRIVAKIDRLAAKIDQANTVRVRSTSEAEGLLSAVTSKVFDSLMNVDRCGIGKLGVDGNNPVQTGPFGAQLHKSEFTLEGVPVLNVGNVWPDGLRFDRLDHVTEEKAEQLARYRVQKNDLLFARSGATLGKVCVVPDKCHGWLMTGHLFRVRFDQSRCDPRFAFAALHGARQIRSQVFGQVRGATRPGFNTTLLSRVELPLPSLAEQSHFVAHLETVHSRLQQLKRLQRQTAAELDALLLSILDRAFKGEL